MMEHVVTVKQTRHTDTLRQIGQNLSHKELEELQLSTNWYYCISLAMYGFVQSC